MKLLPVLLALAMQANATEVSPSKLIGEMDGVYKHRFKSATIEPGKAPGEADAPYQAEDIIEIVRYDDRHVYVRARLEFYNGHSCSISGIAGYENGSFVYHDPEKSFDGGPSCTLKVGVTNEKLTLTDRITPDGASSCRAYCGVRGSLNYEIAKSARRPIRYLDRLKASRQYVKAEEDLRKATN
jgi:hypothetical protein